MSICICIYMYVYTFVIGKCADEMFSINITAGQRNASYNIPYEKYNQSFELYIDKMLLPYGFDLGDTKRAKIGKLLIYTIFVFFHKNISRFMNEASMHACLLAYATTTVSYLHR